MKDINCPVTWLHWPFVASLLRKYSYTQVCKVPITEMAITPDGRVPARNAPKDDKPLGSSPSSSVLVMLVAIVSVRIAGTPFHKQNRLTTAVALLSRIGIRFNITPKTSLSNGLNLSWFR